MSNLKVRLISLNETFQKAKHPHFLLPVLLVMLKGNGSGRYRVQMKLSVTHIISRKRKDAVTFYSTGSTCPATGKWLRQIQSTNETITVTPHTILTHKRQWLKDERVQPLPGCFCARRPVHRAENGVVVVFMHFLAKKCHQVIVKGLAFARGNKDNNGSKHKPGTDRPGDKQTTLQPPIIISDLGFGKTQSPQNQRAE
jgi:hypothetical protein